MLRVQILDSLPIGDFVEVRGPIGHFHYTRPGHFINHKHEVFGYPGMYVIDGSAISANPGVNPSLTILALAERAMTFVPPKSELEPDATYSSCRYSPTSLNTDSIWERSMPSSRQCRTSSSTAVVA